MGAVPPLGIKAPLPQNLKALTSLRFFAAMWVVLFRFWPSLGAATPSLVARGYLGVELFFVLSGFILCHVYLPQIGARIHQRAEHHVAADAGEAVKIGDSNRFHLLKPTRF